MLRIHLWTVGGGYVTTVLTVGYKTMPQVIVWGERFFIKDDHHAEHPGRYVEASGCVWAFTQEELEVQGRNLSSHPATDYMPDDQPPAKEPAQDQEQGGNDGSGTETK